MLRKRNKVAAFSLIVIIMSSILIYAGHFLFSSEKSPEVKPEQEIGQKEQRPAQQEMPVKFKELSLVLNGRKQEVRVLEVDLSNSNAEIKPVLSHESLFGFEKLTSIVKRTNAYAAVNGGFFSDYGYPGGMVAVDGELITKPTGKYPVFIIQGNKARLEEIKMTLSLNVNDTGLKIDDINALQKQGQAILFTSEFGEDTRLKIKNTSVIIKDQTVYDIAEYKGSCNIPDNGMVLAFTPPNAYNIGNLPVKKGDRAELITEPELGEDYHAYECGSWIIKEGKNVIGEKDDWVGLLTNPDPRTAVGIKQDGRVLLVTVDGRQPGYSAGVSGKELGEILLQLGAENAAMLDGGASTEMIVENKIVNKPSHRGEERMLGGALVVRLN